MSHNHLTTLLPTLQQRRQICVVGAAVVDILTEVNALPTRGADIQLTEKAIHVGGCALNIAIALHRLGLTSLNALPIGCGSWADIVTAALAEKGLTSELYNAEADNGWCLALVEPDGERTFLSVSGVENLWNTSMLRTLPISEHAILYLSGYQLASKSADTLVTWLESLPESVDIFIDFGPRISQISTNIWQRLLVLKPIVSLNRQEAEFLGMQSIEHFVKQWYCHYQCPLILRIDSEGAYYADALQYGTVQPFKTQVVDTIGAGDTHAGGVLAGLACNWSLADAVLLGNAVASYVVSHSGGDCAPFRQEMTDYLRKYA